MSAVVLVRDQPQLLQECLDALSRQEVKPDHVIVLDLRDSERNSPLQEPAALGLEITTVVGSGQSETEKLSSVLAAPQVSKSGFVWLLNDHSLPTPSALKIMASNFEVSPSLAQIAPKLLHRDQTRRIVSLGLSSSRTGSVLRRRADEYDQGQFDSDVDVLAATVTGSLFRTAELSAVELGPTNLDSDLTAIAVGIQLRARGQRVAVAPTAWVSVVPPSEGAFEVSRVDLAMRMALTPSWFFWILALTLPIQSLVRSIRSLILKQTGAVIPNLLFGIWFWFTFPTRLSEQRRFFPTNELVRKSLPPLLANRSEVKLRRSTQLGNLIEPRQTATQLGFVESGAFWFILLPLLLSLPLLPIGTHPHGLGLAPLSPTITEVFHSYQLSPESSWLLPLLSLLWLLPGEPAAGFAWINFLLPSVAFISSWQLFRSIIGVRAGTLIGAIVYSLNPFMFNARLEGQPLATFSAALLPWALLGLLRISQSGTTSRRWRWSAITALVLAATSAATPISLAVLLLLGLGLIVKRKLGIQWLAVVLIPASFVLLPRGIKYLADPVAALAGWGAVIDPERFDIWTAPAGGWLTSGILTMIALLLLTTLAVTAKPTQKSFGLLALALGVLTSSVMIPEVNLAANLIATLLLLTALLSNFSEIGSKRIITIGNFALLAVLLLALPSVAQPVSADWRADSRVTPAIVHAAANVNPGVLTFSLDTSSEVLVSSLQLGNGTHIDQSVDGGDTLFRNQQLPLDDLQQAQLAAALAAGSTEETAPLLSAGKISFVLLVNDDVEVRTNLESSGLLESAGVTEWGRLWRVRDAVENQPAEIPTSPWVLANFGMLALYLLLAAPTPGSLRRIRPDSSIFVEGEDQL